MPLDATNATLAAIPDPPALAPFPAAAKKLRLSLNSVARLVESGEIRGVTVGRRRFVDVRSLASYIEGLHSDRAGPAGPAS